MSATRRIEVRVLGELSVRRGGEPLGLPASRKTRALLGYLVATAGTRQPRQRLCDLLWEGPVDPRGELRWSLSKLRGLLGDAQARILCADRDSVVFDPHQAVTDLGQLTALTGGPGLDALDEDGLSRAEALFRGELLAGLELPDCFRFDAWLVAERERLFALHTSLLERQVARLEGAPERALRSARAWVALDPLSEAAHAAVVRMLLALGRPREAGQQADTCQRILKQELGVDPGRQLAAARLQKPQARPEGSLSLAEAPAAPRTEQSPAPFVGRQRELKSAREAIDAATATGTPHLLLVSGEAGIGKSRLLGQLSAAACAQGAAVLAGRAFEAEQDRPYGVWIDLLRTAVPPGDEALAALIDGPPPPPPDRPLDRDRLHAAVARRLAELAGQRQLLVIDDLQWVDPASLALLAALLGREGVPALAVAAGARTGELGPQSPAAPLLRDLERAGRLTRLSLGALSAAESAELVHAVAPEADADEIARASGGHPLFALELARSGLSIAAGLPASLTAAVGERLARLREPARLLATWGAVLGAEFEIERLRVLSGLASSDLLSGIEELERSAVLRPDAAGERYDFAHDVVRRVAYEQISPPRRRFLHAEIARALAPRLGCDGAVAAAVARHAALGGENELAARAGLEAAERCLRLAAPAEAADHCERSLAQLGRVPEPQALRLRLPLLRALVQATQGRERWPGLLAEAQRWVEAARSLGLHAELQMGLWVVANLSETAGDLTLAQQTVLSQAEAARGADAATAVRALANAGRCLAQIERDQARAEGFLREARERSAEAGIEPIDIPWGLGLLAQAAGRESEARTELERAVSLARDARDDWAASQCLARLAVIEIESRRLARALEHCTQLDELAARLDEGPTSAVAGAYRAIVARARGVSAPASGLDAAIDRLRLADSKGLLAPVLNLAAELDLGEGDALAARSRAREALDNAEAVGRKGPIARAHLLLARTAFATGARTAGVQHLRAAAEQDRPSGALGGHLGAEIASLAREAGIPTPVPTPARQTARRSRGERR